MNFGVFLSLKVCFNLGKPDEMQHHAAFHLGLHWLQKYLFRGLQYRKG